jgi:MFS transporter, AAHS family, 4-hydroxybenzoate transporter
LALVAPTTNNNSLNVQQFVDNLPMARTQWLIVGLCFLVLITDGFHTAAMAFAAPALTRELSISKLALGPVLAAALVGLAIGALVAGPLADRFGRKRVLVASVLICSVGSLCTASASGFQSLLVFRFITGTGIGAAMPNCTTLAAEFLPARSRALLLNLMFCGFPLGASSGGFLAAWLIPHFGWRSLFLIGGAAPLMLTAFLTRLPESISFMVVRKYPVQPIRIALNKIAGCNTDALALIAASSNFWVAETSAANKSSPLQVMFAPRLLIATLMLWLSYFMGLLLFYLLTSWMPTLVRDAGYSVSQAATATALFPLGGGIGAILCGWLMGRVNATRVVSGAYLMTAVLMLVLARSTGSLVSLMCMTFLAGLAMNAAQTSMPALAAATYPTYGRASGVSWMLGVGRIGGIIGAFGGGLLLQAGFSLTQIISGLAVVAAVPALALLCKDYADRQDTSQAAESGA